MGNNTSSPGGGGGQPQGQRGGSMRTPRGGGGGPAFMFRSVDAGTAAAASAAKDHGSQEQKGRQVGTSGDGDAGESVDEEAVEVSEDTGPLNLDEATAPKEEEETLMGTRARPMQRAALEVYGGGAGGVAQRINENLRLRQQRHGGGGGGVDPPALAKSLPAPNELPSSSAESESDSAGGGASSSVAGEEEGEPAPQRPARHRSNTLGAKETSSSSGRRTVPTVFKLFWPCTSTCRGDGGHPAQVSVGGSFNGWRLVPMTTTAKGSAASHWCIIIDLEEGEHQYKFKVDDRWIHNPRERTVPDGMGGFNNVITVDKTDFEVFEALDQDSKDVASRKRQKFAYMHGGGGWRRPSTVDPSQQPSNHEDSNEAGGEEDDLHYGQDIPTSEDYEELHFASAAANFSSYSGSCGAGGGGVGLSRSGGPPILPPHLLQVILNKDTPLSCEPTLLPMPNHVLLNHMYALSIKDRVMVMSATQRFKKKYVTTILYRPIES